MEVNYIYSLSDPNTLEIRYIGKSNNPEIRYKKHLYPCNLKYDTYKNRWIKTLLNDNKKPILDIIYQAKEGEDINELEKYYIKITPNLTNTTEGGDGGSTMKGKKMPKEAIEKIIQKQKGRKWDLNDPRREFLRKKQKGKIPWQATNKATEVNSHNYEITYPDGKIEVINNLSKFEREHNLSHLSCVARGVRKQSMGFKVKKINKDEI